MEKKENKKKTEVKEKKKTTKKVQEPKKKEKTKKVVEKEIIKASVKEEKIKEEKVKKEPSIFEKKTKKKFYLGFNARLIFNIIIVVLLLAGLVYTVNKSFSLTKSEIITYNEKGTKDYKVYLKDNSFYDTPYLEKGMAYVASLIDRIDIDYDYKFESNVDSNIDINYKVVAKLIISSQSNSSVFFEKEYDLTKTIIDEMVNKKTYIIDREVSIDYNYYNDLANKFKSNYAVNTNSVLEVSLIIDEKNKEDNSYDIENQSIVKLVIPLSEQEVNINMSNYDVNNEQRIVKECKFVINDISYIVASAVIIIILFVVLTSLLKKILLLTKKKKNEYDRYIKRLLVGYDRIIVNVKSFPNRDDYTIIKVESFQELVDVRDNTKEPINYHVITEHQKCEFFVINDNHLYLYTVKAVDFTEGKKNE